MGTALSEETCFTPEAEPLKYQTWVLKVSVHCQGCKRKVKKALQSMDGVYTASVDLSQQKVVVTGNVDAETLINKLQKAGRRAEPWPEKPKKEKENGNRDDTDSIPNNNNNKDNGGGKPRDKDPAAALEGGDTQPAEESSSTATAGKAARNNADALSKAAVNAKAPCPKGGGRDCNMKSSEGKDGGGISSPPPLIEKPAAGGSKANGGKKGKKGQKEGGVGNGGEFASESSGDTGNIVYPDQLPLVYAVSYSTAYPSTASSGAVYHDTAPAVLPQQSVVYAPRAQQHRPAYYYLPAAGVFIPPSDEEGSYDVFSDENAHACRVM